MCWGIPHVFVGGHVLVGVYVIIGVFAGIQNCAAGDVSPGIGFSKSGSVKGRAEGRAMVFDSVAIASSAAEFMVVAVFILDST